MTLPTHTTGPRTLRLLPHLPPLVWPGAAGRPVGQSLPRAPVYPFIWMNYHVASAPSLTGQQIGREFWKRQLETIRAHADGVVIWGGYQETWDPNPPWWLATLEFVRQPLASPAATQLSSLSETIR